MNYEAGFCVFAFILFCCVLVYALYRRALAVDGCGAFDRLDEIALLPELSRDDVLELASRIDTDSLESGNSKIPPRPFSPVPERVQPFSNTAAPMPKGWQPWEGGAMPLPYNTEIAVMFGDGLIQYGSIAGEYFWKHCGDSDEEITTIDILAYRIAD